MGDAYLEQPSKTPTDTGHEEVLTDKTAALRGLTYDEGVAKLSPLLLTTSITNGTGQWKAISEGPKEIVAALWESGPDVWVVEGAAGAFRWRQAKSARKVTRGAKITDKEAMKAHAVLSPKGAGAPALDAMKHAYDPTSARERAYYEEAFETDAHDDSQVPDDDSQINEQEVSEPGHKAPKAQKRRGRATAEGVSDEELERALGEAPKPSVSKHERTIAEFEGRRAQALKELEDAITALERAQGYVPSKWPNVEALRRSLKSFANTLDSLRKNPPPNLERSLGQRGKNLKKMEDDVEREAKKLRAEGE